MALEALGNCEAALLDRGDLEVLLGVSPRQALRILNALGASLAGKNLFISREELIARLRGLHAGEDARYERRRLQRLDRTLALLARDLRARQVPLAAIPDCGGFSGLPPSLRLRPGRLEVDFATPEELLARLFELSQAIAQDYESFERLSSPGAAADR